MRMVKKKIRNEGELIYQRIITHSHENILVFFYSIDKKNKAKTEGSMLKSSIQIETLKIVNNNLIV